jgi:type IV pilus assembly protein PilM
MMNRLRKSRDRKRWVGLDIGSSSLKLVELEQTAEGVRLIKQLIQEFPVSAEGQPVDPDGWLSNALREFETQEVHVSVGGAAVVVRRVLVPPMSARELPEAVKWQVKDQVPFAIESAVLGFDVIGEVWERDFQQQDVLVAAAATPSVEGLITRIERSGVRVVSLMPAVLALWSSISGLIP